MNCCLATQKRLVRIASNICVFNPPAKPFYSIKDPNLLTRQQYGNRTSIVSFNTDYSDISLQYPWLTQTCYRYRKSLLSSKNKGNAIVILHIRSLVTSKVPFTFLISHGNSSTIGTIYPFLIDFATQMKCDVISYDYSGYGFSEGKPSEEEIYSDIEEVASFSKDILMIKPFSLILFGISLGTAPTIHLSVKSDYVNSLYAVILLSPFAQGLELFSDNDAFINKMDMFDNLSKVSNIECPVFLAHGKRDKVIPIEHSIKLSHNINKLFKWYPYKGIHNNLITTLRRSFYKKLRIFFGEVSSSNQIQLHKKPKKPSCNTKLFSCSTKYSQIIDCDMDYVSNTNHHPKEWDALHNKSNISKRECNCTNHSRSLIPFDDNFSYHNHIDYSEGSGIIQSERDPKSMNTKDKDFFLPQSHKEDICKKRSLLKIPGESPNKSPNLIQLFNKHQSMNRIIMLDSPTTRIEKDNTKNCETNDELNLLQGTSSLPERRDFNSHQYQIK